MILPLFRWEVLMALANIVILGTGGTITGVGAHPLAMTVYNAGELDIHQVVAGIPQLHERANITTEQFTKLGAFNASFELWIDLAERVNTLLADSKVDGVVITHGTDTLEDTAYFLNLVVKSEKPVVITGSMRPASALCAEGPLNIYNAVCIAASKQAIGKGVLVAFNDEIHAAREVTKTNTSNVSTFKSLNTGPIGIVSNGEPIFYLASIRRHTFNSEFSVDSKTNFPAVKVLYFHINEDTSLLEAALAAGVQGIVYVGTGNGNLAGAVARPLRSAVANGLTLVRATRVTGGIVATSVTKWDELGYIAADNLNPSKARILLMLALLQTTEPSEIRRIFAEY